MCVSVDVLTTSSIFLFFFTGSRSRNSVVVEMYWNIWSLLIIVMREPSYANKNIQSLLLIVMREPSYANKNIQSLLLIVMREPSYVNTNIWSLLLIVMRREPSYVNKQQQQRNRARSLKINFKGFFSLSTCLLFLGLPVDCLSKGFKACLEFFGVNID